MAEYPGQERIYCFISTVHTRRGEVYNTGYVQEGQRGFPSITGVLGDDWDAWVNDTNCFCLVHEHIRTHTGLQFFFVCPA